LVCRIFVFYKGVEGLGVAGARVEYSMDIAVK
jgi:hypothetical protein